MSLEFRKPNNPVVNISRRSQTPAGFAFLSNYICKTLKLKEGGLFLLNVNVVVITENGHLFGQRNESISQDSITVLGFSI